MCCCSHTSKYNFAKKSDYWEVCQHDLWNISEEQLKLTPHYWMHCMSHHYISISQDPWSCLQSVLLSSLVPVVPVQIIISYSCRSVLWAELTWCQSAETGCHDGPRWSRPPEHPETEVGFELGCWGGVKCGWRGCTSSRKGGDWLVAAEGGCAWDGDGTQSTLSEMKAGAGPHLSLWIDLGNWTHRLNIEIKENVVWFLGNSQHAEGRVEGPLSTELDSSEHKSCVSMTSK